MARMPTLSKRRPIRPIAPVCQDHSLSFCGPQAMQLAADELTMGRVTLLAGVTLM